MAGHGGDEDGTGARFHPDLMRKATPDEADDVDELAERAARQNPEQVVVADAGRQHVVRDLLAHHDRRPVEVAVGDLRKDRTVRHPQPLHPDHPAFRIDHLVELFGEAVPTRVCIGHPSLRVGALLKGGQVGLELCRGDLRDLGGLAAPQSLRRALGEPEIPEPRNVSLKFLRYE